MTLCSAKNVADAFEQYELKEVNRQLTKELTQANRASINKLENYRIIHADITAGSPRMRLDHAALDQCIRTIPPLPASVQKALVILNGGETNLRALETVVGGDPALTSKILQIANSPFYGLADATQTTPDQPASSQ